MTTTSGAPAEAGVTADGGCANGAARMRTAMAGIREELARLDELERTVAMAIADTDPPPEPEPAVAD